MSQSTKDTLDIAHIAKLSSLHISDAEAKKLQKQLESTLETISELNQVDTKSVEPTSQVTGLTNVFRNDEIDTERMFSQEEALANGKQTHNGYFVVGAVIDYEA